MNQRQIELPREVDLQALFGSFDSNLKLLEKGLMVGITCRDNAIKITGEEDNLDKASEVIGILLKYSSVEKKLTSRKFFTQ